MSNLPIRAIALGLCMGLLMGCAPQPSPTPPSPDVESSASEAIASPTDPTASATPQTALTFAEVTAVSVSGEPNNYIFEVTVRSPDLGCNQYADWWEVLSEDGRLIFRRNLAHSHVDEQPFMRWGSPVVVQPDQTVIVRAHMHPSGYGQQAQKGTVAEGFSPVTLPPDFAAEVADQPPQPYGCEF